MMRFRRRLQQRMATSTTTTTRPPPAATPPAIEFWDRLAICKTCPKAAQPVKGFPTLCTECGCPVQTKAMFPIFHCPLGKW